MIIRHLEDLRGTARAVDFGMGMSFRFLVRSDGMGFTMTDTYVEAGRDFELEYSHHLEACYILEGDGELHCGDVVRRLEPGLFYAFDSHDRHRVRTFSEVRMICVFSPALEGGEVHDFSGGGASGYGKS